MAAKTKKTGGGGSGDGRKRKRRTAPPAAATIALAPGRANVRRVADEAAKTRGGPEKVRLADVVRRIHPGADPATVARHFIEWREQASAAPPELARAIAEMTERFARTGRVDADDEAGRRPGRPAAPAPAARGFLARHAETRAEKRGRKDRSAHPGPGAGPPRTGPGAAGLLARALAGTLPPTAPARRAVAAAFWKDAVNPAVARSVVRLLIVAGHPLTTAEIAAMQARSAVAWTAPKQAEVLKGMLAGSPLERKAGSWWFAGEPRPSRTRAIGPRAVLDGLYLAAALEAVREAGRAVTSSWVEARLGDAKFHFYEGFLQRRLTAAADREGSPLHRTADGRFVWRG